MKRWLIIRPHFIVENRAYAGWVAGAAHRLPPFSGRPIRIRRSPSLLDGSVHGGALLRKREILFDCEPREFPRVFIHEVFHFVWLRLGNQRRWSYEQLLQKELAKRARGELGWSAEWRKNELRSPDLRDRTPRWREYCCESFCDSAAWLYCGLKEHDEFTLAPRFRNFRQQWFTRIAAAGPLSI